MKRVIFDIILFISIFIFPWWVGILLLAIGLFVFANFYEFVAGGVLIFSLYAPMGDGRLISSPIFFSALIIFFYAITQIIKSNIIFYKK